MAIDNNEKVLVARVTVNGSTATVEASRVTEALTMLLGVPRAGMRVLPIISFDLLSHTDFEALAVLAPGECTERFADGWRRAEASLRRGGSPDDAGPAAAHEETFNGFIARMAAERRRLAADAPAMTESPELSRNTRASDQALR